MPFFSHPASTFPVATPASAPVRRRVLKAALRASIALGALAFLGVGLPGLSGSSAAGYPEPSVYPIAWEFDFDYRTPRRIEVEGPDGRSQAYYYMVYTVTNDTDQERLFLPVIEMVTSDGRIIEANRGLPNLMTVFNTIDERVRSLDLTAPQDMFGTLRVGEDQAKSSVAIWREPAAEMGTFHIYVGGLSGETVPLTGADGRVIQDENGQPINLRKTRQITLKVRGDEVRPGQDVIDEIANGWVMR